MAGDGGRSQGPAMTDLWRLDATELARLIRLGRASSREAMQSCLERLANVNPKINAVVRILEEEALAVADKADKAQARGETLGPCMACRSPPKSTPTRPGARPTT